MKKSNDIYTWDYITSWVWINKLKRWHPISIYGHYKIPHIFVIPFQKHNCITERGRFGLYCMFLLLLLLLGTLRLQIEPSIGVNRCEGRGSNISTPVNSLSTNFQGCSFMETSMRAPFHVLTIFLILSDPLAVVNANSEGKPTPLNIYIPHVSSHSFWRILSQ